MHDQLNYEKELRKKTIREQFTTAKNEQNEYLKLVAKQKKSESIRKRKMDKLGDLGDAGKTSETTTSKPEKAPKLVKQRKIAKEYSGKHSEENSSKILNKFFG